MFTINQWHRLEYEPHTRFVLPNIYHVEENGRYVEVPVTRSEGHFVRAIPLYRLVWPGQVVNGDQNDFVPAEWVDNQQGYTTPPGTPGEESSHYSLRELLTHDCFPEHDTDVGIIYHMTVNRHRFFQEPDDPNQPRRLPARPLPFPENFNLMGLHRDQLSLVMDMRFALPPEYVAAIQYMKWLCEAHWHHPLLQGFDTVIRDDLMSICQAAHANFFHLLADCPWENVGQPDIDRAILWERCARYFHWAERTGRGLVWDFSDMQDVTVRETYPEMRTQHQAWLNRDNNRHRGSPPLAPMPEPPTRSMAEEMRFQQEIADTLSQVVELPPPPDDRVDIIRGIRADHSEE